MRVGLLTVGHRQPSWVQSAFKEYAQRLPRSWHFKLVELDPGRGQRATPEAQGERVLAKIATSDRLIALDERGQTFTTKALAGEFNRWCAGPPLWFAIGGADGFSDQVRARADALLSLSALTLPHGLARVVLIEQLYRVHTLQIGHPYHRDG